MGGLGNSLMNNASAELGLGGSGIASSYGSGLGVGSVSSGKRIDSCIMESTSGGALNVLILVCSTCRWPWRARIRVSIRSIE